MPHEIAGAVIEGALQVAGEIVTEIGTESVRSRWGWRGCLTVTILFASAIVLFLWFLGVFSR